MSIGIFFSGLVCKHWFYEENLSDYLPQVTRLCCLTDHSMLPMSRPIDKTLREKTLQIWQLPSLKELQQLKNFIHSKVRLKFVFFLRSKTTWSLGSYCEWLIGIGLKVFFVSFVIYLTFYRVFPMAFVQGNDVWRKKLFFNKRVSKLITELNKQHLVLVWGCVSGINILTLNSGFFFNHTK